MAQEYNKLLFGIRRSIRYHMRRCRFFDSVSRVTSGASLIFGSSTLFMLLYDKGPSWLAILPALVGAASIIALVYEAPRMARLHSDLARRSIELEQKMVLTESPDESDIRQFTAQKLAIEIDEPPVHRVLDLLCRNEMILAEGQDESQLYRASPFERLTAQVLHLEPNQKRMPRSHAAQS